MAEVVQQAATVIGIVAVLTGGAVLAATRSVRPALPVFLDLLLAAGLLRLTAAGGWEAIGTAAGLVLVRRIASRGILMGLRPDHQALTRAAAARESTDEESR